MCRQIYEKYFLAESIRVIIESQVVSNHSGKRLDSVTISLGVAQFLPGEDAATFISRADACLYTSKGAGRNRVTAENQLTTH